MAFDRRRFLQLSAASLLSSDTFLNASGTAAPTITDTGTVAVKAGKYSWQWSQNSDVFRLLDNRGRVITDGLLQPAIAVKASGDAVPRCSAGQFFSKSVNGNHFAVTYHGVNHGSKVVVRWRFEQDSLWFEPVVYESSAQEDVIALHYFANVARERIDPTLRYSYLVQPGLSESSVLSPVVPGLNGLDLTTWLGHGGGGVSETFQQWGLPTHYFCLAVSESAYNSKDSLQENLSDTLCFGLADLPAGDLLFQLNGGTCGPVLNVRSDLWGHARGPGSLTLGAAFYCAIGRDYREATREYYLGLVRAGVIRKKINSATKNAVVTASAFDTWGAEVAAGESWAQFNQNLLNEIYRGLTVSGMKPDIFIIDAKWEGKYGELEHSQSQFPHFESFLEQVRSDGHRVGLWAAFIRCEDPESVGLRIDHMLRGPDGKAIVMHEGDKSYYLYDVSQPETQEVLTRLIQRFMKRYRPDLVKFDFGYELPSLSAGAPKNMAFAGERLFMKSVQVIVGALRSVNPDVVVMYYSLSPLFIDYFDLNSPDDMFDCVEDYQLEANRRFFFSSLLGEIGMPTYGSGGYDWISMREIWFDSAVVGSVGSLGSFSGDERGSTPMPELVAKYNGLAQITRNTNIFNVQPLDPVLTGSLTGAHSSSWVRIENGEPMLVALRQANLLGEGSGPGRYKDIVQCDTSLVVASKTAGGIGKSKKLGIVPYGNGEVVIRHDAAHATAVVTKHLLGNTTQTNQAQIENGELRIPLKERMENNSLVEWLEVEFV